MTNTVSENEKVNPLRWAFGQPLPTEELERWLLASPAQRIAVTARLNAIRDWPNLRTPGAEAKRVELCGPAGVTPKRMANMVAAWRAVEPAKRTLAMLGLRVDPRRSPKLKTKEAGRKLAKEVVQAVVRTHGFKSVEAVVTLAHADPRLKANPVGSNMLREFAKELRLERGEEKRFGEHIVVDQLPLAVCAPSGIAYRAVLVLDEATRLALGSAIEAGPPTLATVRDAARDAAERLRKAVFPGVSDAGSNTRVTVAVSDPNVLAILRFFAEQPGWTDQIGPKGRLAGAVLGGSIGRIGVRPGLDQERDMSECDETIPRVSAGEVKALVDLALSRHNQEMLGEGEEEPATSARRLAIAQVMEDASFVM